VSVIVAGPRRIAVVRDAQFRPALPFARTMSPGPVMTEPSRVMVTRALAAALLLVAAMTACASTAQTTSGPAGQLPAGSSSDGLSMTSPGAPLAPGAAGSPAPGLPGTSGLPPGAGAGGVPGLVGPQSSEPGQAGATALPTSGSRVTGPIKVGFLYSVNDGADQAGVDNGNNFSVGHVVRSYVDSFNSTGGFAGRHIDPVYFDVHSASSDYDAQMQAACSAFTEDNHVAAVISASGYYSDTLFTCLTKAGVPLVGGDFLAPDRSAASRYPLFITPTNPLADTRYRVLVERLAASGFLRASHKIGVVVEGCPTGQRLYQNAVRPALSHAGLAVAATSETRCFQSLQDLGGMTSDTQNAVLQFSTQGVDRVLFVSAAAEGNLVLVFTEAAEAQHYRPGYAIDSVAAPAVLASNIPGAQMQNMRGLGWVPKLDSQNPDDAEPTSTGRMCLHRLQKDAGLRPSSAADYYTVYGACDAFALYDTILRTTRGQPSSGAVLAGLDAIGGSYVSATTVNGRESFGRAHTTGASAGRLFAFNGGCTCFRYTSSSFAL
jgi:hypothetical protein